MYPSGLKLGTSIIGLAMWGKPGKGAFLGSEVTGVEGVAHRLTESDLWNRCVIQKTFENIFGRPVLLDDV